ncbi:phage tail tape measure protein [Roseibium sp.]|uniref:phage tail tape measure protein n=1 Tax=Roseibium sp. TaxID=1936156 RepID=UPI003D0F2D9D
MSNLSFKMVLRLVDQASSRMNRIANNAQRMAGRVQSAVGGMSGRVGAAMTKAFDPAVLDAATNRVANRLDRARTRLMDAVAMGAVMVAPVLKIGRFEHSLAHFGNVADMTKDQLAGVEAQLRVTAAKVNQSASDLLGGLDVLLGKGLSEEDSTGAIEAIGKAATATGAQIDHLAFAAYAGIDNLGIPVAKITTLLDMLAKSGKEGGFELRDMAKHMPGLTAAAKMLGIEGTDAAARLGAALQIAVKGAGDPDEAANNFKNFLAKIVSPETVTKFKKLGIDIRSELENATAKGLDPMEYMLVRLHDLAETNPYVIGDVFGDMQVQNFLKPIIANLEEYARIRDETLTADGVIDKDYDRVMDTMVERWKALVIEFDNASAKGNGLAGVIKSLLTDLTGLVRAVNDFATAHPQLTGWIIKGTAALLAFGIAGRLVSYGFWLLASSVIGTAKGLAGFVRFLARAKGAVGGLGQAITSMAKFSWGAILTPLKWAAFVPKLAWRSVVSVLRWASFVPRVAWAALLKPLRWTAFIPKVGWATLLAGSKLKWSLLITPLKWFGRFIPGIGWAILAAEIGMLAWDLLIKPLKWDEFLNLETLKSLFNEAFGWIEEKWNGLTSLFSSAFGGGETSETDEPAAPKEGRRKPRPVPTDDYEVPEAARPGRTKKRPEPASRYERLPSPAEYQSAAANQNSALTAALERLAANQNVDAPEVVEVPQQVDQSKTVHQTNTFNIRVIGGPASAGQAVGGAVAGASRRALSDSD